MKPVEDKVNFNNSTLAMKLTNCKRNPSKDLVFERHLGNMINAQEELRFCELNKEAVAVNNTSKKEVLKLSQDNEADDKKSSVDN